MPLGFLYQVLSLSLIRSDSCAFWFRVRVSFCFSQFDFFFCLFSWKFFSKISFDWWGSESRYFFFEGYESVWFGKFEIAICYWFYMATKFVEVGILFCLSLRGLLLDFLCIIAAFTGLWNFGSWNLDILWVSSIRVRIKIRCLFLRVMTCELVGF